MVFPFLVVLLLLDRSDALQDSRDASRGNIVNELPLHVGEAFW